MKVTDKYIYFWEDWLSNWYHSEFTDTAFGRSFIFSNSEQHFMFQKALYFKDNITANQILQFGVDPKEAKRLGRKVANYDEEAWAKVRFDKMYDSCLKKFSTPDMKARLLNPAYDGKHFVEGSPFDKVWGIGVHYKDAKDDQSNWNGENLLGQVLDKVRETLKEQQKQ